MEIIRHIPNAEYIITSHWEFADYKTAVEVEEKVKKLNEKLLLQE